MVLFLPLDVSKVKSACNKIFIFRLNRASHNYLMPIILSDEVNVVAAFYGTFVPVLCYFALQTLVIRPYKRKEKER